MTNKELLEIKQFLLDLHFIQANALVAAKLQNNKQAIDYMNRIGLARQAVETELKEKNT